MNLSAHFVKLQRRFAEGRAATTGALLRRGFALSFIMLICFAIKSPSIFDFVSSFETSPLQDFWAFYAAARAGAAGDAVMLYDASQFQALFSDAHGLLWLYPPAMLLFLAPFGVLPYGVAKLIWVVSTFGACAGAAYLFSKKNLFLTGAALISPVMYAALFTGQLSVLFGAALALGLYFARTRPLAAAILLAFASLKPQIGLLVPFVLIVLGAWRALIVAALGTLLLMAASVLVYDVESWRGFFTSLTSVHAEFLQASGKPGRITIPDLLRFFGWPSVSTLGVGLWSAALAAFVLFKKASAPGRDERRLIAFALMLCAVSSPYFWVYDASIIVFAILIFLSSHPQLGRWSQGALLAAWAAPILPYLGIGSIAAPLAWAAIFAATLAMGLYGVQLPIIFRARKAPGRSQL